jgi:hypothetical protein
VKDAAPEQWVAVSQGDSGLEVAGTAVSFLLNSAKVTHLTAGAVDANADAAFAFVAVEFVAESALVAAETTESSLEPDSILQAEIASFQATSQ